MDQVPEPETNPVRTKRLVITSAATEQPSNFDRMSSASRSLAHEFNNLLTGMLGNLELLERRAAKLSIVAFDDYLSGARNSANRAIALTRRLEELTGGNSLEPKPILASTVISNMWPSVQAVTGNGITATIHHPTDLWRITCDENSLKSALLEIIINARDAMPEGGALSVMMRNVIAGPENAFQPNTDYVAISIKDSGSGMAEDEVAHAFEPYFTRKSNGSNLGLGLSIVFSFLKRVNGIIEIDSVRPGGSTITLYFPRAIS
jgi:signal transduction histidine kinase